MNIAAEGKFSNLRSLGLSNNHISDAGCLLLAAAVRQGHFHNLRDLFLSRNDVGDRCTAAIGRAIAAPEKYCSSGHGSCGAPHLERLGMNDNRMGHAGLSTFLIEVVSGKHAALKEVSVKNNSGKCFQMDEFAARLEAMGSQSVGPTPGMQLARGGSKMKRLQFKLMLRNPQCQRYLSGTDSTLRTRWTNIQIIA